MKTLPDVLLAGFQVKMGRVDHILAYEDRRSEAPGVIVKVQKDNMMHQIFLTEKMLRECREPPDELVARHIVNAARRQGLGVRDRHERP